MRKLHYLKGIAVNAFESRKIELKMTVKMGIVFHLISFYIFYALPQLGCLPVSEITQTDRRNMIKQPSSANDIIDISSK
ncbi:hypothetical protein BHOIPH791_12680 [Bartonella henselae]|uniref:hypothetical protein n=1 Tax=Bartonella henselae TaxID=38323 RepID=UPI0002F3C75E|nr:hypothetical protein [Bartonella henselae]ATP12244.1 hypothetical protein BhenCHDE101_03375 [Bartonella henselae]ETS09786.1 hypothetical protein Q654_00059 [Bartonella henselae JK 50]ETS10296.1 hypothetical protein Q655_00010 [Bartonella henselae JK 51]MDM9991411.1 hypothetical protein [Bartonella henselae]OLL37620.1 hypothetical protein AT244_01965 [Bartonella henselae]